MLCCLVDGDYAVGWTLDVGGNRSVSPGDLFLLVNLLLRSWISGMRKCRNYI